MVPLTLGFSGFNSQLVTSAWVGFDNNRKLGKQEFGGSAALPIWIDFMADALAGVAQDDFPVPDGLVRVRIDPETGLRARPGVKNAVFEIFRRQYVPAEFSQDTEDQDPYQEVEQELF